MRNFWQTPTSTTLADEANELTHEAGAKTKIRNQLAKGDAHLDSVDDRKHFVALSSW